MNDSNIVNPGSDLVMADTLMQGMDDFCRDHKVSPEVRDIMLMQIVKLKDLYGKYVPKTDVMNILTKQIEITRSGLVRVPVGIEEFLTSKDYMDQGSYVRPAIMEHLIRLFEDEDRYYEVVLGGAIGIGKNYFSDMAMSYILYKMSCLYSPQSYYGLAPGTQIVFIHQSKTLVLARKVVYEHFAARIKASAYFPKYFNPSAKYAAELKFPNNISLIPVSGSDTAAIGMNVFGAVIDEMNFLGQLKKDDKNEEPQSRAEKLYRTILRRMEARFMKKGKIPGKLFLISSANYKGDFIDQKEEEAKTADHIFVMHLSQWEALPNDRFSGRTFYVALPDVKSRGYVADKKPRGHHKVIEVPEEYRNSFERSLEESLRDIAGIPIVQRSKYIDQDLVFDSFRAYQEEYPGRYPENAIFKNNTIFKEDYVDLSLLEDLHDILNLEFLNSIKYLGPFGAHIDMGLTGDSAGIAIGSVTSLKDVGYRMVYDKEKKVFVKEPAGEMPVITIFGAIKVTPPKEDEISISALQQLLLLVNDYLLGSLKWVTTDGFESASTRQFFRSFGLGSYVVSVDRNPEPYREYKLALREGRLLQAESEAILDEAVWLEQDIRTGKVDHAPGHSKDLNDAITAVVWEISRKKSSYRKKVPRKINKIQDEGKEEETEKPQVESERVSTGRRSLY